MDWLIERVRWHLDPNATTAKIFLAENRERRITGQGIATSLAAHVEDWFTGLKMPKIVYNTAETNAKLIDLLSRRDYKITHSQDEMVQLTKFL